MKWSRGGHRIINGDVREALRSLPAGSVQCCVTSPPYWGLRDYGTAQWEGGDAGCDHAESYQHVSEKSTLYSPGESSPGSAAIKHGKQITKQYRDTCGKCGARRIDRQIGQEPTPDAYVETMVEVFREVRRVLHDSGTVFLNVGDSYARPAAKGGSGTPNGRNLDKMGYTGEKDVPDGLKEKDLCLIPWRLAIALQQDGWWIRSVICWAKKSCMPESVTDRPTNSWEPIFLLAKSAKYFMDMEAVKEQAVTDHMSGNDMTDTRITYGEQSGGNSGLRDLRKKYKAEGLPATRNMRNVWHLGPEPYAEAHFATFPTEIPRRAILAGTSARGCCPKCYAPWVRVVEQGARPQVHKTKVGTEKDFKGGGTHRAIGQAYSKAMAENPTRTVGWEPGCECYPRAGEAPSCFEPAVIPCTVLDPFSGAGTTGVVCEELDRRYIGIELSPEYVTLSVKRMEAEMAQGKLFRTTKEIEG